MTNTLSLLLTAWSRRDLMDLQNLIKAELASRDKEPEGVVRRAVEINFDYDLIKEIERGDKYEMGGGDWRIEVISLHANELDRRRKPDASIEVACYYDIDRDALLKYEEFPSMKPPKRIAGI